MKQHPFSREPRSDIAPQARRLAATLAAIVASVGCVALFGWVAGIDVAVSVVPGLPTMKFNTALCFVLCGLAALWLRPGALPSATRASRALALVVLAIAGWTLVEYTGRVPAGIDQWPIPDRLSPPSDPAPGRMSVGTALAFVLAGLALQCLSRRQVDLRIGQAFTITTGVLGAASLIGYLLDVELMRSGLFKTMALHTSLLFVALSVSIMLRTLGRGLIAPWSSVPLGGGDARWLMPATLTIPLVVAMLVQREVSTSDLDSRYALVLATLLTIILLLVLSIVSNLRLNRLHAQLSRAHLRDAWLAAIIDGSDDAIISKTLDGTVTSWNAGAEQLYGYSAAEMIGRSIATLLPHDAQPAEEDAILAELAAGRPVMHGVVRRRRKDGQVIDVSLNVSPVRDPRGLLVGASHVARDVTEVRRSQALFEAAVEAAPSGMFVTTLDGGIELVNALGERQFGIDRSMLIGRAIHELVPEMPSPWEPAGRAQGLGIDMAWETEACRRDSERFPVEIRVAALESVDGPRLLTSILDVSDRRRAEFQLAEKAEELQRSNRDLEHFAYIASHDLHEPLRAVSGSLGLLRRRYTDRLDEHAQEFIDLAVDGAERMKAMIDGLLAFSRVGRHHRPQAAVDAARVVEMALKNLAVAIRESEAEIAVAKLPTVLGNEMELLQVFQNLIGNAIKYRRAGRAPHIRVDVRTGDGLHEFSISDDGIGIDPRFFDRIFQMFQRLHTRREYAGSGVGLALCRRIIETQGGSIWVTSDGASGSSFHFTLMVATPLEASPPETGKRSVGRA